MSSQRPMSFEDWGLLVALSILWGMTFFFAKIALVDLPPVTLVQGRVWIGAAALLAYLLAAGVPIPRSRTVWIAFLGMGLLNNVIPFSLIFLGQSLMPKSLAASLAAILNATTPVFTMVIAHFLTRDEKLTGARLGGVALGVAGVAVMLAPRLLGVAAAGPADHLLLGAFLCLSAALVYGLSAIFARRFKTMGVQPLQIAFGQLAASSLVMPPLAALVDQPWRLAAPGAPAWLALMGLGLLSTACAYVLFFRILATAGATNLMLVTLLIPVSAIFLGAAFLGERLALEHVAGVALIASGLAAIDGRLMPKFLNK